jgi:urea transport system ATP-binding protein
MLNVENLSLYYGGSKILHDITFKAALGQVTCIMGTNGVGKTSLLKAISGTHPRSSGDITISGQKVGIEPANKLAKLGVGYVPQGRDIFPLLTVKENLETGFACLPAAQHIIPDEMFGLFPVLKEMLNRRGGDLSGGQQQQLAIARALITKPRLLLLDEPTEGIQPNIIQQIGRVIAHLRAQGDMAIILVEQYFEFAFEHADQFVIMRRGHVTNSGTKGDISKETIQASVSV